MKQRLSARHQLCGAACGNQTAPAASMHVQKCQPKQATPCCAAHLHPALVVLVKAPGRHSIIAVSGHRVVDAGGAGGGRQAAGHGSGQQGRELVVAAKGCVCIAGGHAVVGALLLQLGLASTLVVQGGQPAGDACAGGSREQQCKWDAWAEGDHAGLMLVRHLQVHRTLAGGLQRAPS